jgi:transposase
MMRTTARNPDITPIPVQLSAREFNEFIFPHLSMPKRGPQCKLGYHRLFNLILWVLYTGMPWKCLPIPKDVHGKPAIHYTTVYRAFAKWSDDDSLQQAFMASVAHLSEEKQLDLRVLHGDGTNTVAKKGGMALATLATNIRRARRLSPLPTTMAISSLHAQWLPSMRRI